MHSDSMAVGQAWNDTAKWVYRTIDDFQRRHGGEFDQHLSDCGLGFARAVVGYDPSREIKFATYLRHKIWGALLDNLRREWRVEKNRWEGEIDCSTVPEDDTLFDRLLRMVGDDAGFVLWLASSPPPDLKLDAAEQNRRGVATSMRGAIYNYLRDIGWSACRIAESFKEIADALAGT